jgi:superfamily II DNA or RNA helicase
VDKALSNEELIAANAALKRENDILRERLALALDQDPAAKDPPSKPQEPPSNPQNKQGKPQNPPSKPQNQSKPQNNQSKPQSPPSKPQNNQSKSQSTPSKPQSNQSKPQNNQSKPQNPPSKPQNNQSRPQSPPSWPQSPPQNNRNKPQNKPKKRQGKSGKGQPARPPGQPKVPPTKLQEQLLAARRLDSTQWTNGMEEKLDLYLSLFVGKADAFVKKFEGPKGCHVYMPGCRYEWVAPYCEKPGANCAKCMRKRLLPFTRDVAAHHMIGTYSVGTYPILANKTCRFVIVAFEEKEWEIDSRVFRSTCSQFGIDSALELSRLANSGFVWIFFESPVKCADARKLASALITKTMDIRHVLSYKTYDRITPNQNHVSGEGQTIVPLPLDGISQRSGTTVFVDSKLSPYPDQLEYLAGINKVTGKQVEEVTEALCKDSELGELGETVAADLDESDVPRSIRLVKSGGLLIPMRGFSARAVNKLKRLAAFENPDFASADANKEDTRNKERVFCRAVEINGCIQLPRAVADQALHILEQAKCEIQIVDNIEKGKRIEARFVGKLREEQKEALDALMAHDIGIVEADSNFGKVEVAAALIAKKKISTLILVNTTDNMIHWQKGLLACLDKKVFIGRMSAVKHKMHGVVDIVMLLSMLDAYGLRDFTEDYGMIIVDECHMAASDTCERILSGLSTRHVYGFTENIVRKDGKHPIALQQCGPIRYKADAFALSGKVNALIPRFTSFNPAAGEIEEAKKQSPDLFGLLSGNAARNELIIKDAADAINAGKTPLILAHDQSHGLFIMENLKREVPATRIALLSGDGSVFEMRRILTKVETGPREKKVAIIATNINIDLLRAARINLIMLSLPIAWEGALQHFLSRMCRDNEEGKATVIDYVDMNVPELEDQYKERLQGYAALGYQARGSVTDSKDSKSLFCAKDYRETFAKDIRASKREVFVASPSLDVPAVRDMSIGLIFGGAYAIVATKPPVESNADKMAECIEILEKAGARIVFRKDLDRSFAVIDKKISWHGGVDLLGSGNVDEILVRLENDAVTKELAEMAKGFS